MDPSRWQRLGELFERARELPAEARRRFLEEACPDDVELRGKVESLILHDEGAGGTLHGAVDEAAADLTREALDLSGQRLGPYRIERLLGEGGMGSVWLASRDDQAYTQKVAIKVARGLPGAETLRRFRAERQILAALDHPNIARMLDGGATAQGAPYVVMEQIEGRPIDVYCNDEKLSTEERLALFLRVCDAVQYAHGRLVVHRDIKPGNILVTDEGEPKLLDFGIAKLLDTTAIPGTLVETATSMRMLTPEYASPEQVRGADVTVASDVYGLGLLLYELLSDRRAQPLATGEPAELLRVVCEKDPDRPSIAASRRRLAGDLDNIVMMALRKEPERRYASVGLMAEDLRRHLDGLPVLARAGSWRYRAGKFLRRNTLAVSAGALVVLLLVVFAVSMALQAGRVARERDTATRERETARRVSDFMIGMFEISDPGEARGESVTAREILDEGAMRIRAELGDEPEMQATMMRAMGRVYLNLGLFDDARPLMEQSLRIRTERLGEESNETATSTNDLANVLHESGDLEGAERLYERARTLFEAMPEPSADAASNLNDLANLRADQGAYDEARPLYEGAARIWEETLGPEDRMVGLAMSNLAFLENDAGNPQRALELFEAALEHQRRALGPDHPDVGSVLYGLGQTHRSLGNLERAEQYLRQTHELHVKLRGPRTLQATGALNDLALVLQDAGKLDEAEPLFGEVLALRLEMFGENQPSTIISLHNMGWLLFLRERFDDAGDHFRRALEAGRTTLGEKHWVMGSIHKNLGRSLEAAGKLDEAEAQYRAAVDTLEAVLPEGHINAARARLRLASAWSERGRLDEAEPLLRRSVNELKEGGIAGDRLIAEAESRLGVLPGSQGASR